MDPECFRRHFWSVSFLQSDSTIIPIHLARDAGWLKANPSTVAYGHEFLLQNLLLASFMSQVPYLWILCACHVAGWFRVLSKRQLPSWTTAGTTSFTRVSWLSATRRWRVWLWWWPSGGLVNCISGAFNYWWFRRVSRKVLMVKPSIIFNGFVHCHVWLRCSWDAQIDILNLSSDNLRHLLNTHTHTHTYIHIYRSSYWDTWIFICLSDVYHSLKFTMVTYNQWLSISVYENFDGLSKVVVTSPPQGTAKWGVLWWQQRRSTWRPWPWSCLP